MQATTATLLLLTYYYYPLCLHVVELKDFPTTGTVYLCRRWYHSDGILVKRYHSDGSIGRWFTYSCARYGALSQPVDLLLSQNIGIVIYLVHLSPFMVLICLGQFSPGGRC